jgi:nicotinamide mononucleotide transporter
MTDAGPVPAWLAAIPPWEALAVALALAYLWLAIRQNAWCWPAAILSSAIYIGLMYEAGLYMESALQVFYIAMALYGWQAWRRQGPDGGLVLRVHTWPWGRHVPALAIVALLTAASGRWLETNSAAAFPYLDSFVTWGALLATWMVARKLLENWLYWFVVDGVSLWLYLERGLVLTAGLFAIYLVMVVQGYLRWRRAVGDPATVATPS